MEERGEYWSGLNSVGDLINIGIQIIATICKIEKPGARG